MTIVIRIAQRYGLCIRSTSRLEPKTRFAMNTLDPHAYAATQEALARCRRYRKEQDRKSVV